MISGKYIKSCYNLLQFISKKSKKNVDTIRKKAVRSDVWEMIKKGVL